MADIIKTSDFVENTGDIRQLTEELLQANEALKKIMDTIKAQAGTVVDSINKSTKATSGNLKELEDTEEQVDELAKRMQKLKDTFKENNVQLEILKQGQRKANQITKNQARLAQAAEGSYDALAAQYNLNKIRLNAMSEAQRKATKEGKALEEESKAIYERMKELQEATGKHVLSVGDYGKALRDLPGPLSSVVDGVEAVSTGFKAMLANPVVLVLGLIVGALTAVFKAFQQSETGAKLFNKAGALLSGIWKGFVQVIDIAARNIQAFFDDPLAGIKELGTAIVDNIVNRFKAVLMLIGSVSKGLNSLIKRDFEGVKKAAEEAGGALLQFSTGLDEKQRKDLANGIKDITNTIEDATAAQLKYNAAKEASYKVNSRLRIELAKLNAELELANSIANDDTQGYKQQQEAIEAAQVALEKKAKVELQLANESLKLVNLQIEANKGVYDPELYQAQADALIGVIDAQSNLTQATRDNAELRRKIQRDEFERYLDYAIDVGDAQKSLLERQLKDEKLSLTEKAKIFDDLVKVDADRYEKQKKLVEDYYGQQIDFDKLIKESNESVIADKILGLNVDDIVQGRILEIIRDRKAAIQDLVEAERDEIDKRNKVLNAEGLTTLPPITIDESQQKRLLEDAVGNFKEFSEGLAEDGGFWDFLKFEGRPKEAMMEALGFIKDQFSQILDARVQLADRMVEAADREVQSAQDNLRAQQEARDRGDASNVEAAEKRLRETKKQQDKAIEEQRKAVKAQQALQTVEQTGNMITASSKIWSSLGYPLAIPAIALMWGSFIASKVKASQLAKAEYGQGHYEEFNYGGSHASGNDIPLGVDRNGRERRVERGESFAVFNTKANRKYGSAIPDLVRDINNGSFDRVMNNNELVSHFGVSVLGADMSKTESELTTIRKQGEQKRVFETKRGRAEIYKNRIIYYDEI